MAGALPSLFNAQWYLLQYRDVAAAVESGQMTAEQHFELYGKAEGRSAGPLFNAAEYLRDNPDVAEAVEQGETTAYDHFLQHGMAEGRSPLAIIDTEFYLTQNPDVAAAIDAGDTSAIQHLLMYGLNEGRQLFPFFNLQGYLEANDDVAEAVDNGETDPLSHLLQYGIAEGRLLSNGVDLKFFANDPAFKQAIAEGRFEDAMSRVGEVAPFLPDFTPPIGWQPATDTPIPQGFVPPAGQYLIVPDGVVVPPGTNLPDAFGPDPDNGGGSGGTEPPPGSYFLTEEIDNLKGTSGNDIFYATSPVLSDLTTLASPTPTLQTGDRLDGRGGKDILYILSDSYVDGAAPTLTNIEGILNFNVAAPYYNASTESWENGAALDLSDAPGVEAIASIFVEDQADSNGFVSALYRGASLGTSFFATGIEDGMVASLDITFKADELIGAEDTLTIGVAGQGGSLGVGWNNNTNTDIEKVVIQVGHGNQSSVGFADYATVNEIEVKTGSDVFGGGTVPDPYQGSIAFTEMNSTTPDSNALEKIDASTFQGDVRVTELYSTSLREILTGSGNDVIANNGQEDQIINSGAGNDEIHIGTVQSGHAITTGDGADVIYVSGTQLGNIRQRDGETGSVEDTFEQKIITITDFNGAHDKIVFEGSLINFYQHVGIANGNSLYDAIISIETLYGSIYGPTSLTFEYEGSTYIYQSNGDGAFGFGVSPDFADGLIKLAGYTGDLNIDNFDHGSHLPG